MLNIKTCKIRLLTFFSLVVLISNLIYLLIIQFNYSIHSYFVVKIRFYYIPLILFTILLFNNINCVIKFI